MAKRKRRRHFQLAGVSKQDFEAIAAAACKHAVPEGFVRELASYFTTQNPRFSPERFVAATRKC